ncbi:alpha/beta fold hydrolase [Luteimonas composti]|uniref:Alpha/beta fold hydrolase n=1 Tax=Luteimonas composti TaxID=398257 RepID=A0ABT6MN94_9GAMM|nr:alpha/beta fold hydrolase [Luteimonas composti]MDH7451884.1 alpha/beta fold hydrolase [Luteimonas composti]
MNPDGGGGGDGLAAFAPPPWLRSPHLQTVLGSSAWRARRGARELARTGAATRPYLLDGGDGVRLLGLHSAVPGTRTRGLVLLLHGWEGSAESSYMRLTAAQLLARGYEVFRLNFRDHGDTHHLNPDIFHSCRIDEVVCAAVDIARRFPARPLLAAGYSLGGNFALRLALHAPAAGLPLERVAAVCPVIDPARTMQRMEAGPWPYRRYFQRKWRGSLLRKRALFPDRLDIDDATLRLGLRELTDWLVRRHTRLGSIDNYFDGYSIAGDRLRALRVPAHVLMAADDPVIPVDDFHTLELPAATRVEIQPWGGHCGFLEDLGCSGYAERWTAARLASAPH